MVGRLSRRLRRIEQTPKSFLQFTADAYPLGMLRYAAHVRSIQTFLADAAAGHPAIAQHRRPRLPQLIGGEPPRHPPRRSVRRSHHQRRHVRRGVAPHRADMGLRRTRRLLRPRVTPPAAVEPDDRAPESAGPWRFDRYGFRVPAVIVSPFARPDYVSHVVHDHTSILKLIETKWNLPPLTRRDAQADNLLDSLDLSSPPAFARPPLLPAPALPTGESA